MAFSTAASSGTFAIMIPIAVPLAVTVVHIRGVKTMRVYISVDLEGINGIVAPEQVLPEYEDYKDTKKLVTAEVCEAISGASEAGASEIIVNDSHHTMRNVDIQAFASNAKVILGETKKYSMVQGLDETFDAALFIGYHAKAGTSFAIMDHSFYPKEVLDIKVNGISYGEIGLNMLYASEAGVPVVLVTGDKAAAMEAADLNPSCRTVCVKEAQGRFSAKCLSIEQGHRLIRKASKEAVLSHKNMELIKIPQNPVLEMEFSAVNLADSACLVPGTNRTSPRSISFQCKNIKELYMWRQVFCALASAAYNKDY